MTNQNITNRQEPQAVGRRWGRWVWIAVGLLGALAMGGMLFLQSEMFQEMVRRRLIAALEQTTGGRVELNGFSLHLSPLEVNLQGFVLHGREGAQEPPLFSAELLQVGWKLRSVWGLKADLNRVRLWQPKLYIAAYEEGRTNIPFSPRRMVGGGNWVERVLAVQIGRLEVLRGQFRWNEKRLPLDFRAENFRFTLDYEIGQERYSGRLDSQNLFLTSRHAPLSSRSRARFRLYSNKVEMESLEWQTPKSRLAAQATLEDFRSPRLQFQYNLQLDWKEMADFLGKAGWEGDAIWSGQGSYGNQEWRLEGDLRLRAVKTGIAALRAIPWGARSLLRLVRPQASADDARPSPWRAELQGLEVRALGGRFTGAGVVEAVSPQPTTRLDLQAHDISLPALANALSALPVPLARLQWAGMISGPVQARFVGMGRDLAASTDWQVEPPLVVPLGFTPVSGILRGSYQAGQWRLETQSSYINLPRTHLTADGWLGAQDSRLEVSLDTTNYDECRSLAELVWKESADLPFTLFGRAQGEFLWSGGTRQPNLNGHFALADFSYQKIRWDHFSGNLQYQKDAPGDPGHDPADSLWDISDSGARTAKLRIDSGRLTRGRGEAKFRLRLGLENGSFAPRSPFSIEAALDRVNLEDLESIVGLRYPLRGTLEASVRASGTRQDPRAQGTVLLTAGTVYEEPFDRLSAQWSLEPGSVLSLREIFLQKGKGTLEGTANIELKGERYRLSITGANLPVEEFRIVQARRFPLTGLAQIRFSGEGSFDRPQVQGKVEIRQLGVNGKGEGRLDLDIEARDQRVSFEVAAGVFGGELRGSGEVPLEGLFPLSARLNLERMDIPLLLRAVRRPSDAIQGQASGVVTLEGSLKRLETIGVRGELSSLEAMVGPVRVHNRQPVRFRYQNRMIQLEQVHLVGEDLDLEATGGIRWATDPTLSLTAKGRLDLAALRRVRPDLASSGEVLLDASLNGTLARPVWRGRLVVSDGDLRYGSFPNGLDRMKGTLVFEGSRAVFEDFTAESGGGQVELSGFVSYAKPTGWQLQIAAEASGVRVRYPPGLSTLLNGQLSLTGGMESSLLTGSLVIQRQTVSPEFDLAAALLVGRGAGSEATLAPSFLRNLRLDLGIVSAPDVRLETFAARNLQGDVDLRIQGTLEHPSWLGRIGITQGEVSFAGRRYSVNHGDITFVNPFRIEPILSLNLQARVQQYDISLDFSGPADRLNVTYRSDPPVPTRDVLALLVAGSARQTTLDTTANRTVPELGASSLLSQALTTQIGSRLDRIFGAGRIRIDPQLAGFGRPADASVALEQPIGDNLTVLYITNVTSVQQQTIQAEWVISPRFSVVGIRDRNGLVGVNLQLSLRFR